MKSRSTASRLASPASKSRKNARSGHGLAHLTEPNAMKRSTHRVRFLHPQGWSYYATLRRKLRWYEGVV